VGEGVAENFGGQLEQEGRSLHRLLVDDVGRGAAREGHVAQPQDAGQDLMMTTTTK
jgi:hypothetical protein